MQGARSHSHDLLLALSHAARSIQRARTVQEAYSAVGSQIKALGEDVSLFIFNEDDASLNLVYTSYEPSLLRRVEKLMKDRAAWHHLIISPDTVYARALDSGATQYIQWTEKNVSDALPPHLQPQAGKFLRLLKIRQGILASLRVDDQPIGLMVVSGSTLLENDVPAMESFAAQIAVSIHNVRLTQQMQEELSIRRQLEQTLRISEARNHALLDALPDIMFLLDRDGVFIDFHAPRGQKLLISPQEFMGKNMRDALPLSIARVFSPAFEKAVRSGESQRVEYDFDFPGKPRHFEEAHIVLSQDDSVLIIIRDITERRQAEMDALLQSAALEAAANAIAITDKGGDIQWVNSAWVELTGYSKEESVGQSPNILKSEKHPPQFYKDMWDTVLAGRVWRGDLVNKRKDGSLYFEEETITPVLDDQGHVTHFIAIKLDVTKRKQAEADLERMARTDVLTGIYNRRHLFDLAVHEFDVARRYGQSLSIIMFDLDHFKDVNDTYGHAIGDQMLVSVTQVACSQLRDVDLLGRYGGEEFLIVLPMTEARYALKLAERIRSGVEALRLETEKGGVSVTLSIGIAELLRIPLDGSVDDIIRRADEALYIAKQSGRNRAVVFDLDSGG